MSWEQLKNILDANRSYLKSENQGKPHICPIDGTILVEGKNGMLNCPMGNYRWPSYAGTR
jgi:hypothetical protein